MSIWFFFYLHLHQVVELLLDAKAAAPGGEDLAEMLEGFLPKIWCFPFGWKHVKYPKIRPEMGHMNNCYELAKVCHGTLLWIGDSEAYKLDSCKYFYNADASPVPQLLCEVDS